MKKTILNLLILLILLVGKVQSQEIETSIFKTNVLHDDFNKASDFFPIITTTENYFILDNGDYLLSRNNPKTQYAILAEKTNVKDFLLRTVVRIGPSDNKTASIGVMLKVQKDGSGGIIVEINSKKQYRVRQLIGDKYINLSGKKKNDGWKKSKLIEGIDEHNFLEIRTNENIYDLYINSQYCTSFFIPDYTSGMCGLIIGPKTKARVSYFYIDSKESNKKTNLLEESISSSEENKELKKKIQALKKEIENFNTQLESFKKENEDLTSNNNQKNAEIISLNTKVKNQENNLNAELKGKEKEIQNLLKEISTIGKEKDSQKQNLNTVNDKLKKIKKDYEEIKKQLYSSENKRKEIIVLQEKTEKNLQELNKNIIKYKEEIIQISRQLKEQKDAVQSLEYLQKEHKAAMENITNLENEKTNLISSINKLQKELVNAEKTNEELKNLFVYKDFEVNGINTSDLEESINYPNPKDLEGDQEVYSVQVAVYQNKVTLDHFNGLKDVWYNESKYDSYIYMSGQFRSPEEATAHKNSLIQQGYQNAFVVKLSK